VVRELLLYVLRLWRESSGTKRTFIYIVYTQSEAVYCEARLRGYSIAITAMPKSHLSAI
jgi:hypothetical protein